MSEIGATPTAARLTARTAIIAAILLTAATPPVLADPPIVADPPVRTDPPTADGAPLAGLLTDYFKGTSADQRSRLARKIEAIDGITVAQVAAALPSLPLWPDQDPGIQTLRVDCPRNRRPPHATTVHIRIPDRYDATQPYPLILALHGSGGNGEHFLPAVARWLGDEVNDYVIAAPTDYTGVWLGSRQTESQDLPTILTAIKHACHVDGDRVYITGYSLGGHASFVIAALYGDYFAASVSLAGTFALQSGWEAVELLLPNLRDVPVLAIYGELDRNDRGGARDENSGISGSNRHLARMLQRIDAPIQFIELPGVGHRGVQPPHDRLIDMFSRRRPHDRRVVHHWFRYPAQGGAGWIRQDKFFGRMWRSQRLVVTPAANQTYSEAMTAALKDRLAFVGGTIEGQTIRIRTRKCARVQVLLNSDLIDLGKPITLYMDGTRRFSGPVSPRIATMLEMARRDWDFDRLWSVRFEIDRDGRAIAH